MITPLVARAHYEAARERIVIAAVLEATPHLGRPPSARFVTAVLSGSLSREVVVQRSWTLSAFGALGRRRSEARRLLAKLIHLGLLEEVLACPAGVVLTVEGRAFYDRVPGGAAMSAVSDERIAASERSGLLEALRCWRRDRAHAEGAVEPRLLDESTLREIACVRPKDTRDLLELTGIRPRKAALYGEELVRIVREHARPPPGSSAT